MGGVGGGGGGGWCSKLHVRRDRGFENGRGQQNCFNNNTNVFQACDKYKQEHFMQKMFFR